MPIEGSKIIASPPNSGLSKNTNYEERFVSGFIFGHVYFLGFTLSRDFSWFDFWAYNFLLISRCRCISNPFRML